MASVEKSVLVPYSAAKMFDLVARVEEYPQFLPWCAGATILERNAEGLTARLDIDYHGVRAHFTTENRNLPPDRIAITLRDGPFHRLDGDWHFQELAANASKVELGLRYEFSTVVLEKLIGPVFSHIANTFIDSFVRRAETIHGRGAEIA